MHHRWFLIILLASLTWSLKTKNYCWPSEIECKGNEN